MSYTTIFRKHNVPAADIRALNSYFRGTHKVIPTEKLRRLPKAALNEVYLAKSAEYMEEVKQGRLRFNGSTVQVSHVTDHHLMVAFQGGDEKAFTRLYRRHIKRSREMLSHILKSSWPSLRDDIIQLAWSKVARKRHLYRGPDFLAWFFIILRSAALNSIASEKRHRREALIDIPDVRPSGLQALIEPLPPIWRDAFILYFEAGFTLKEIADRQGLEYNRFWQRWQKVLAHLRQN